MLEQICEIHYLKLISHMSFQMAAFIKDSPQGVIICINYFSVALQQM